MSKYYVLLVTGLLSMSINAELRDPTMSREIGAKREIYDEGYSLNFIIKRDGKYIASINGITVKVGDTIGDKKVAKIDRNKVILGSGKGKVELEIVRNVEKNYGQ